MAEASDSHSATPSLVVVTPVFNDWRAFSVLVRQLDEVAASFKFPITLLAVDDGSFVPAEVLWTSPPAHLAAVEVVSLRCNLGHQRALAVGLAEVVCRNTFSMVLVMDCDGEDSPLSIIELVQASYSQPAAVVVASRARRSEGGVFRALYWLYKHAFRWLTGNTIDFGNFCLLPAAAAQKLAFMPDCWNHLAAAIVKSRLPIIRVPTVRASRYCGKSSMSLVALVVHGLSAIAVFIDTVLTRLLLLVGLAGLAAVIAGTATILVRLFSDLAIPGWATNAFGLSTLLFLQSLTLLVVMVFSTLNNRSAVPFVPGSQCVLFVAERKSGCIAELMGNAG
jgi:hypothetical protein